MDKPELADFYEFGFRRKVKFHNIEPNHGLNDKSFDDLTMDLVNDAVNGNW
jgi:hypothetical protein